jgi:hypothetical protein
VPSTPVVGIASSPATEGYWLVTANGTILGFGDVLNAGSTQFSQLNAPMVGVAANGSQSYWEVGSDGGIFNFGTVDFYGSMGGSD